MAKVAGPLMSILASGSIGKRLTYRTVAGRCIVSRWTPPTNPRSDGQVSNRTLFAEAMTAWHSVSDDIKANWNNYCFEHHIAKSGMNLFVGAYVDFFMGIHFGTPDLTSGPPTFKEEI